MPITNWFKRPSFSRVDSQTPEKKEERENDILKVSSPLTEPTSSFVLDRLSPTSDVDADAQLKAALFLSTQDSPKVSLKNLVKESFGSIGSESGSRSQRVIKNGKEIVISSDGEDTDSNCSLEDPGNLFTRASHSQNGPPTQTKKIKSPKKWKYNLDSLVHDAVDDNEVEANVTRYKAALSENSLNRPAPAGNRLNESMLITALGDTEADSQSQRVLGAIRRTNALDYDRTWFFFDNRQTLPPAPEFPKHTCAPGTSMEILRDSDARSRLMMSGEFIETALSKGILSDEVVLWMFQSVPYEPEDELNKAYRRIIKSMEPTRLELLIRRRDVDDLFTRFGATKHALDPSATIIPMSNHEIPPSSQLADRGTLISALKMFREITYLLADDTQEHIALLVLRLTLDNCIMADTAVFSELQWTIDAVLDPESFTQTDPNDMIRRICTPLYNTLQDVCIQSRLCHNILPTSPLLAQLRCRLAISFLFQNPRPLAEPLGKLLDLKRIIKLLSDDKRFQVRSFQGKPDYDWRELIALTALLGFAIDLSAFQLNYKGADAENNFNADIDKLAMQIKTIFSSIQVSGASHMTLTLAKGDLEALHYRILYSIRSKPPPKKTPFESHTPANGDIRSMFSKYIGKDIGDTEIPIR